MDSRVRLYAPRGVAVDPALRDAILEIPGVRIQRGVILAPDNAAQIVAEIGCQHAIDLRPWSPPRPAPRNALGARSWLQEAVVTPGFLTSYQVEGVRRVLSWPNESGLLIWSAGSGKSLGSLVATLTRGPAVTVIVTKAAIRPSWDRQIREYTRGVEIRSLIGESPGPELLDLPPDRPVLLITGYDTLPAWIERLEKIRADGVIFDEIHRAKSSKRWEAVQRWETGVGDNMDVSPPSKPTFELKDNQSAACYRLSRSVKHRLGLTATPIRDRVRDLWAQLDLVRPWDFGGFYPFAKRYCAASENPFGGMDTRGSSNLAELKRRLAFVCHNVPHSLANRSLPPARRLVTYVPISQQVRAQVKKSEVRGAVGRGPAFLREFLLMEAASRKRRIIADHVGDAIDGALKTVVFTGRKIDVESLREEIEKRSRGRAPIWSATGSDTPEEREVIRAAYMKAPGPAVLIATGESFGECLAPDTFMLGVDRPLAECRGEDEILAESGFARSIDVKVHPYSGTMVEIKAQGVLPLQVTAGHAVCVAEGGITPGRDRHFYVKGRGWKTAETVAPWDPSPRNPTKAHGDFLLIPRLEGKFFDIVFDLDQHTPTERGRHVREARGCPSKLTLDRDLAWAIGLYVAQGSATDQPRWGCKATFAIDAKKQHLADRIVSIFAALGISATIRRQDTWLHVIIGSGPVARLLRELAGSGAANKRIPREILLHTDLDLLRAFLDGYAAGDGYTTEGGRKVQAVTISRRLALHLQLALARFGRLACLYATEAKLGKIEGRVIHGKDYFTVVWRWENKRHERFKVLDRYLAVPVRRVESRPYQGLVGSATSPDSTLVASNVVIHNGLDLQDTDLGILAMLPVTPGQVVQCEGRWVRLGMKRPVLIRYFIAEGTYDEHVSSILLDKLPAIEKTVDLDEVRGLASEMIGDEKELLSSLANKILGI